MLLQRGPLLLSPGSSLPPSPTSLPPSPTSTPPSLALMDHSPSLVHSPEKEEEPVISHIVDNLLEMSCDEGRMKDPLIMDGMRKEQGFIMDGMRKEDLGSEDDMNGNLEEASSSGNSSLTSDQMEEVEAWQAAELDDTHNIIHVPINMINSSAEVPNSIINNINNLNTSFTQHLCQATNLEQSSEHPSSEAIALEHTSDEDEDMIKIQQSVIKVEQAEFKVETEETEIISRETIVESEVVIIVETEVKEVKEDILTTPEEIRQDNTNEVKEELEEVIKEQEEMKEVKKKNEKGEDAYSYEIQLEKSLELTRGDAGELRPLTDGARTSIHRVTFNTRNEVASEDTDGSLLVTYCPLEQKIRKKARSPLPGRDPIKVRYVDRNLGMSTPSRVDLDPSQQHHDQDLDESSESEGWENPFQPEGEVSQDADYILRLWKGGNLSQEQDLESALASLQAQEREEAETLASAEALEAAKALEAVKEQEDAARREKEALEVEEEVKETKIPTETRLVHIDKQKHKNLLKKHCSLM